MITCPVCQCEYEPATTGGACPRCALHAALRSAHEPAAADEFEFIAELGRGAMGAVSLARQRSLDRLVALKVIAQGPRPADWLEARLLREARAAAQISHPHIVTVHEVGIGPAGAYLAMEYCEGGDLRAHLAGRPLAPRAAATLGVKLAAAVAHAHAGGILHRDLKPSNILLTAAGEPKITDFGLSSATQGTGELTRSGEVAGSPSYLAPELLEADPQPGPAVDVYGLGAVLYECVTGRAPFIGESTASVLSQVHWSEPVPPRALNPDVSRDLETVILKCLEKNPAARYPGAPALQADLQRFLDGRPIHARPVSPLGHLWRWARRNPALAGAGALVLALLVVVAAGSSLAAWHLEQARLRAEAGEERALAAEAATRVQLRASLVAQAHATRLTAREGQRFDSLRALQEAAAIGNDANARSEAVAALTLPDWSPRQEFDGMWSGGTPHTAVTPLPDFSAFIHETETGVFSRRTFPAGEMVWTWPGVGSPRAGTTVVSPDGRWVAARLQNDEIHVLDAATGTPVFHLTGRPFAYKASRIWGYGTDMAFSADGELFAATRPEGGVTIHRTTDGATVVAWETPEWITSLAFARRGTRLAAGGSVVRDTNVLAVVDAATGELLAKIKPSSRVEFVAWSADDRWIAAGTRPLQVHAAADLSLRSVLPERTALHGHFLPDGRHLLTSEQIGQTRLWDIDSGRLLLSKADSGRPGVWFADGQPLRQWRYFTHGQVVIQELHQSEIFRSVPPPYPRYTTPSIADPLDLSPDGRWLSLGGWGGPSLYDLHQHRWRFVPPPAPSQPPVAIGRFGRNGREIWIGVVGGEFNVHALQLAEDAPVRLSPGEPVPAGEKFLPTAAQPEAGVIALADYQGGRYRLLNLDTRQLMAEWPMPRATYAAFSPDGRLLQASPEPGTGSRSEVRETATGNIVQTLSESGGQVAAWSPDGQWVAANDGSPVTQLWRTADWSKGPPLPATAQGNSRRATFSPDSRWLAVNENNHILLLEVASGRELLRLEAPEQNRFSPVLRFSPDGRLLVVPRLDGSIHLWEVALLRDKLRALGLDWAD